MIPKCAAAGGVGVTCQSQASVGTRAATNGGAANAFVPIFALGDSSIATRAGKRDAEGDEKHECSFRSTSSLVVARIAASQIPWCSSSTT